MGYQEVGDTIVFDVGYENVFTEPGNLEAVITMRDFLKGVGLPMRVVLQPGDGTRYDFLLVPTPTTWTITRESYETPPVERAPLATELIVTDLSGMVKGVAMIGSHNKIEGIRHRLFEKADIPNPCTREALARLVEAVWSDGWQP